MLRYYILKSLECSSDKDCPDHLACNDRTCRSPCVDYPTCEDDFVCWVANHSASCVVRKFYMKDHKTF